MGACMEFSTFLGFVAGLVALVVGAEILVRGASRLSLALGISPLVVGLTVVAFGTSAPEIAVSVKSGLAGSPDLMVGNVLGSNIANVLLVLGVAAFLRPIAVSRRVVKNEVPVMIGVSLAVCGLAWVWPAGPRGAAFVPAESILLLSGAVLYTIFTVRAGRRDDVAVDREVAELAAQATARSPAVVARNLGLVAVGIVLLVQGADWLVESASTLARAFGVSELVIGLTIVAVGTSLPEVATAVAAVLKGERDIAVGNVVGSNVMNLLAVIGAGGVASMTRGEIVPVVPDALLYDFPFVLATAFACLPVFWSGQRISRGEGATFIAFYVLYLVYLVYRTGVGGSRIGGENSWILAALLVATVAAFAVAPALRSRRG